MKNKVVMYEKIRRILKNKIVSGLLPYGARLPSREAMSREYRVSKKTARRAVALLEEEGLVSCEKRKRPVVIYRRAGEDVSLRRENDSVCYSRTLYASGRILCRRLCRFGLSLCEGDEWEIPERILSQMCPEHALEFWRLSKRFWRFFISRIGNDFILRAVDSLGLTEADPAPGSPGIRTRYLDSLQTLVKTVKKMGLQLHSLPVIIRRCIALAACISAVKRLSAGKTVLCGG